jgi:hypothetical protein
MAAVIFRIVLLKYNFCYSVANYRIPLKVTTKLKILLVNKTRKPARIFNQNSDSMRHCFILFFLLLMIMSCSDDHRNTSTEKNTPVDTIKKQNAEPATEQVRDVPIDTIRKIDTTTLAGKATKLLADLKESNDYAAIHGKDTLIDLNGDGHRDLLIEYYAGSGTGLKNGVGIYLFNNRKNKFLKEAVNLPNPTFNLRNNTVVSYYVAIGSGYATELKWHGLRLDTLESIEIEIDSRGKKFKATAIVHNHLTGKQTKKRTDMVWLPEKYKYWDYQPIIRRE